MSMLVFDPLRSQCTPSASPFRTPGSWPSAASLATSPRAVLCRLAPASVRALLWGALSVACVVHPCAHVRFVRRCASGVEWDFSRVRAFVWVSRRPPVELFRCVSTKPRCCATCPTCATCLLRFLGHRSLNKFHAGKAATTETIASLVRAWARGTAVVVCAPSADTLFTLKAPRREE
jgi:hypothetical protein